MPDLSYDILLASETGSFLSYDKFEVNVYNNLVSAMSFGSMVLPTSFCKSAFSFSVC